jgi:chromosome segregation ATPase
MSKITNLFARLETGRRISQAGDQSTKDSSVEKSRNSAVLQGSDVAAFERLGENQKTIEQGLSQVAGGLSAVQGLVDQVSMLSQQLGSSFEEHRRLALANASLSRDRDRAEQNLNEKRDQHEAVIREMTYLRPELEEKCRDLERARGELESLEHRHQIQSLTKKEIEDQLTRTQNQLATALGEVESNRAEISSLQDTVDTYGSRINEVTGKLNEAVNQTILLGNRQEVLDAALQQKADENIRLIERVDLVSQEKDEAVQYGQQREQEIAHLRGELGRVTQLFQQEKKSREIEANQLKSELGEAVSKNKTLVEMQEIVREESEKNAVNARKLDEKLKRAEINESNLENKIARLESKLESISASKSEIENSRSIILARLEAVTQAVCEKDGEINRLEGEVAQLAQQLSGENSVAQDTIEGLRSRIFELEKEILTHRNDSAFLTGKMEG